MKNKLSIEEIIDKVAGRYSEIVTFNEYELLLFDSGIKKDEDLIDFFVYAEGDLSLPVGLNLQLLRKKLRDEKFLMLFATNLFDLLEGGKKQELAYTLEGDDYFLNKKNEFYRDKIVFKVNYNPIDHTVTVNDLVVAKPNSFSENDNVIEYLFNHPNEKIEISTNKEIICKEKGKIKIEKKISKIINQLGFKNLSRRIFFSGTSEEIIQFRNPITSSELKRRGYNENLGLKELFPDKIKKT